jgi:hypothetical protein
LRLFEAEEVDVATLIAGYDQLAAVGTYKHNAALSPITTTPTNGQIRSPASMT